MFCFVVERWIGGLYTTEKEGERVDDGGFGKGGWHGWVLVDIGYSTGSHISKVGRYLMEGGHTTHV